MTHVRCLLLVSLSLVSALQLSAQTPGRSERIFASSDDTVLELRHYGGQVVLFGWEQPQVRVLATRRSRAVETHFEEAAGRLHIHTHLLQASAPASERVVDYEIWAPAGANLEVHGETGSVLVESFRGDVRIDTVAASVVARNLAGYTTIRTLNGSVEVAACSGRLDVSSISGTLRFLEPIGRYLQAETTSGDIFFDGDVLAKGSYFFTNHEGSIELALPTDASFNLTADSSQGSVFNEFPLTPRTHGRLPLRTHGHSLLGTVQSGDALIRVTTFSGTIRIRKR
jgi:DUF4097 and DUF4098 domain-containing protein YvlB